MLDIVELMQELKARRRSSTRTYFPVWFVRNCERRIIRALKRSDAERDDRTSTRTSVPST